MNSMFNMKNTACDLCGTENLESIYTTKFCIDSNKNLWQDVFFIICKKCGLIFENPRLSPQSLKSYYTEGSIGSKIYGSTNATHGTESTGDLARKEQFNFIHSYLPKQGRMLDVGARDNAFIKYWDDLNYKIYALEPGPAFKTESTNVTLINEFYEDYKPNKLFDVICIRHVLEHTFSPFFFLDKAWNDLADNGLIFIEVPNIYIPFVTIVDFFIYYHTFNFSPVTLKSYLAKTGFKTLDFSANLPYSGMRIIAKKTPKNSQFLIKNDYKMAKKKVIEYKNRRKLLLDTINKKIKNVEGKKAAIFGAGEHSAQLIKSANIDLSKIDYFLDNDPNKQGEKFFGLPIHSPKIIQKGLLELILISSYDYQEEISDIIRKYDSTVEVVKFYEKVIAYNTYQDTTS